MPNNSPSLFSRLTGGASSQPVRSSATGSPASTPTSADSENNPAPQPTSSPTPAQPDSAPTPQPTQNTISIADLLHGGGEPGTAGGQGADDPITYANAVIEVMTSGTIEEPESSVPRVNLDAMQQAFGQVDFTTGVDMSDLLNNMQDPEKGPQALQAALQQNSMNVLTAFAPLMNQLVQQAVTQAQQSAVTASGHNMLRDSIVTAFMNKHPYAANPVASRMLNEIAGTLVKSAPQGTPVDSYVSLIHNMFSGISQGTGQQQSAPGHSTQPQGAQSDFSGLFTS